MTPLALTATDAAAWAGLITAAAGGAVAIIAALKSTKAEGKADAAQAANDLNSQRITNTSLHAQSLDRQITAVAQNQPVPTNQTNP